jgi:DNA-binding HxlR family transcriptional regulator
MTRMRRSQARARRSGCPIGIALDSVGDPWTLLVVRDLMFKGATAFHDFQHAGEGIATNVLSDRLARLEAAGIVDKAPDPADARRHVYRLTAKGMDLGPVLVELVLWSARHERTDAPAAVVKAMRRDRERFLAGVRQAWAAQDAPD